jgi:fumarate reductase subunit D
VVLMKRSHEPVFWSLFGAGGVVSALLGPILIFITGIIAPTGQWMPPEALAYPRVLAFAQSWAGKAALLVVISLFLWHAVHRIYHSLHDLGIHAGAGAATLCYGFALAATLATGWLLLIIGF